MVPDHLLEAELLRQWRQCDSVEGRRALLEQLLEPYLGRIARWALRHARTREDAREVAQDALLAVCANLDGFRGEARFSTWLYTLVRNHALKRLDRAGDRREAPLEAMPEESGNWDTADSIDQSLRLRDARSLLASALTPLEARVFLLHFGLEMPLAAIDRELRLTNRSGARAYLVSAKRKLRRVQEGRARRARARRERNREDMRGKESQA